MDTQFDRLRQRLQPWSDRFSPRTLMGLVLVPGLLVLLAYVLLPDAPQWMVLAGGLLIAAGQALLFVMSPTQPEVEIRVQDSPYSLEDLRDLATRIHVTADGVVRAAQAIAEVAVTQSTGANEQAEVIRLTNQMMEDFLHLSERINTQARTMTETAQHTSEISESGQVAIQQTIQGMSQIRRQVLAIGGSITRLAQLTRRIDQIITSVSEIATQSNLLALNASIEAARAGTHGRGFAVVADEVRALSQQSTMAAQQVRAILAEIQTAVKETITATEIGMQGLDSGLNMTQKADQIMVQLTQTVNTSNQAVRSIYDVIRQQVEGLEGISFNIERIDRITQQNLTSVRLVDTVSDNLSRLAEELQVAVEIGEELAVDGVRANGGSQDHN